MAALALAGGAAQAQDAFIANYIDNPDPTIQGAQYTYTATVGNSDLSIAATHVVLTMTVPAGTSFVSATFGSSNTPCSAPVSGVVSCNLGTIAADSNALNGKAVTAVLTLTGDTTGSVTSTATVTSDTDTNASNNSFDQTTTITAGADLSIVGSVAPDPVAGGANASFSFQLGNAGGSTSQSPQMAVTLSANLRYVSAGGSGWSCSASGQTVTCGLPSLAAGTQASPNLSSPVTLVATALVGSGTLTATATASESVATQDPNPNNNTTVVHVGVIAGADLAITSLAATTTNVVGGANDSFTITAVNNGPSAAASTVVTDTLPAGWTYVSASASNYSCSVSGQVVSCNRTAAMPSGQTDTLTLVATAPSVSSPTPGTDSVSITSATTDPQLSNNSASIALTVNPDGTDLQLNAYTRQGAATPSTSTPVVAGATITHSVSVTNLGPRAATGNVQISLALSPNETYVPGSLGGGWGCAPSGSNLLCTLAGGLAVNATSPTLSFSTTVNGGTVGTITSYACTGGSTPSGGIASAQPTNGFNDLDPNATNNCSGAQNTTVTAAAADLAVSVVTSTPSGGDKIVSPTETSAAYTITATNSGPSPADSVVVTFVVPGYLGGSTGSVTPAAGFSCSAYSAVVTCTENGGNQMAASDTRTFTVVSNRPLADTWTNSTPRTAASASASASINSTTVGDPNRANNSASDTVQIDPLADLSLPSFTVSPTSVNANVNATYTLALKNNGPSVSERPVVTITFDRTDFTIASASTTYGGANCAIDSIAQKITCSGFTKLTSGEQETISFVVMPAFVTGEPVRTLNATATVTPGLTPEPSPDPSSDTAAVALAVTASNADLLVNINDSTANGAGPDPLGYTPTPSQPSDNLLVYYTKVSNLGPSLATNVTLSSTYTPTAAGRSYQFEGVSTSASGPFSATGCDKAVGAAGSSIAPLTTKCTLPSNIAASGNYVLYWAYLIDTAPALGGDTYNNSVTVAADETDPNSVNNTSAQLSTVRTRADIQITNTASNPTPNINQPFDWSQTLVNNGPGTAESVVVTDTLPAGLSIIGTPTFSGGASGSCTVSGQTVTCAIGNLAPSSINPTPVTITITNKATRAIAGMAISDTTSATTTSVDPNLANNSSSASINVVAVSLAGRLFLDANLDGIAEAGETTGKSGATVTLSGTDAYGNAVSLSTTTGAGGSYSFTKLPPSDSAGYSVQTSWPAATVGGSTAPSGFSNGGSDSATKSGSYAVATPAYSGVVLDSGPQAASAYNFPYYPLASLSGVVYVDANANGSWDGSGGGDQPISGATVRLLNAGTLAVVATATTNASGAYSFNGLDPYTAYTLEEPLPGSPAGLISGSIQVGSFGAVACSGCTAQPNTPAANTNRIAAIDFRTAQGNAGVNFNFGMLQTTSVGGTVFWDKNGDGLDNGSDSGLAGVAVALGTTPNCSPALLTTSTAANGSYSFGGSSVVAGRSYYVCATPPGGYGTSTPVSIQVANLGAGGSNALNFGMTLASVNVLVFSDYSVPGKTNNGTQDAGEAGLAAATVTLTGTDLHGSAVNTSASTNGSGAVVFAGLMPGTYSVAVTAPAGYNPGIVSAQNASGTAGSNTYSGFALAAGSANAALTFAELPVNAISGTVFIDTNGNRSREAGEPALGGAPVGLYAAGTNCAAPGTAIATTTTDVNGSFTFAAVSQGSSYRVCLGATPNYRQDSANGNAGNYFDVTNLGATGSGGNRFGVVGATLSAKVFLDGNDDGLVNGSDAGIAGVALTLRGVAADGSTLNLSASTDANGNASFGNVPASGAGGYTLAQSGANPVVGGVATMNGKIVAGSQGGTPSAVTASPASISAFAIAPGSTSSGATFAKLLPVSASGRVFVDINNDGLFNGADSGIAGQTLNLVGTDDTGAAVALSTVSAADGTFAFNGLRPGTYEIDQNSQPANTANGKTSAGSGGGTASNPTATTSKIATINLATPGASSSGNLFAEIPANETISGKVFTDLNNNGVQDSGEPGIGGVTINLSGTDANGSPVSATATTAADGSFGFSNLLPGTYQLDEPNQPAGTFNGITTAGSAGGQGSNPTATSSRIANIALTGNSSGNTFAELAQASLSGTVWYDTGSTPGVLDAGDQLLAGWTVQVVDPVTNRVIATATSDASGNYAIPGLPPATDLRLRFVAPGSQTVAAYPVDGNSGSPAVNCASNVAQAIASGSASSCKGPNPAISERQIVLAPGQAMIQQSLPVDPSGVVYNASTRTPLGGATVSFAPVGACAGYDPATQVLNAGAGGYTVSGSAISMTTGPNGFYEFLLLPSAPASCEFGLTVTPPSAGYSFPSTTIPPQKGVLAPSGGPGTVFLVQAQAAPPTGAQSTAYATLLMAGSSLPAVLNNHIPLDPASGLGTALTITKTGDKSALAVGDTLLYTITVHQNVGATHGQSTVLDTLPRGFSFIRGTASLDGQPIAPVATNPLPGSGAAGSNGPLLSFNLGPIVQNQTHVLTYRVRAGAGADLGDMTNRAQAFACATSGAPPLSCMAPQAGIAAAADNIASSVAAYKVEVGGGAFGADACLLGKVFIDCNGNQVQDPGEIGIPGVRIYLDNGKFAVTDQDGQYSFCGLTPVSRVAKIDEASAPAGSIWIAASNANFGDARSVWVDLKNGMQHRADFIEGSCTPAIVEEAERRHKAGDPDSAKRWNAAGGAGANNSSKTSAP